MKSKLRLTLLMVIAFFVLIYLFFQSENNMLDKDNQNPIINELIADNEVLYPDSYGKYHDLIEIYNSTDEDINLKGYGLSDDAEKLHKWQFPEIIIKAGEYLLVSASGNQDTDGLYTNFKLNRSGEKIFLSDNTGEIISSVFYKEMLEDMSYGFDGREYVYFLEGTPGLKNTGTSIRNIDWYLKLKDIEPEVLLTGGIYAQPQTIEFKQSADYVIRYTLDGSIPDKDSPVYKGGIDINYTDDLPIQIADIDTSYYWNPDVENDLVNSGQVIRAQYFFDDIPVGRINTNTYFIWEEGNQRYSFDIVSLSTDADNLFSGDDGIMVVGDKYLAMDHEDINSLTPANYNFRGRAWEREGHLEIFDDNGELTLSQDIGIRVAGEASRAQTKKSLRIIARDEYDDNQMSLELFDVVHDDAELDKEIDSLIIRSGGQDWNEVIFRDILTGSIINESLTAPTYTPSILFINGEYFGIYNLREDMNEEFIENHYNLEKDEFIMIEDMYNETLATAENEEELTRYKDFFDFLCTEDLSDESNYDYVEAMMDLDNYIDYLVVNIFIRNPDFYNNNIMIWRYIKEPEVGIKDGRYRYIIYDTDMGYNYYEEEHYAFDSFKHLETREVYFFANLMTNDEFKLRFINKLTESLNNNLSKTNVKKQIAYFDDLYSEEIKENTIRWQITAYDESIIISEWYDDKVYVVEEFIDKRQEYLLSTLENRYGLEEHTEINVRNQSDNPIIINNDYEIDGRSTLVYYPQFQDKTLKLEFKETDDVEFLNWYVYDMERNKIEKLFISGDLFSEEIEIKTDRTIKIETVFNEK